jgi:cardiolipin synthase
VARQALARSRLREVVSSPAGREVPLPRRPASGGGATRTTAGPGPVRARPVGSAGRVYHKRGDAAVDRGTSGPGAAGEAARAKPATDEPALAGAVARHDEPPSQARIWTVPNAISLARLAGVPVFLWLVLGPKADGWAVGLLIAAGFSDWLDGKIARAWNQQSRLGQVLDPAADRLYIAATLVGLAVRAIIPWWLVGLLVARELVLGAALLVLRHYGYPPLQVSLVGKAATACLLYAFPLLFLGAHGGTPAMIARIVGWAFAVWGTALYWWAAGLYLAQARTLISRARTEAIADSHRGSGPPGDTPSAAGPR